MSGSGSDLEDLFGNMSDDDGSDAAAEPTATATATTTTTTATSGGSGGSGSEGEGEGEGEKEGEGAAAAAATTPADTDVDMTGGEDDSGGSGGGGGGGESESQDKGKAAADSDDDLADMFGSMSDDGGDDDSQPKDSATSGGGGGDNDDEANEAAKAALNNIFGGDSSSDDDSDGGQDKLTVSETQHMSGDGSGEEDGVDYSMYGLDDAPVERPKGPPLLINRPRVAKPTSDVRLVSFKIPNFLDVEPAPYSTETYKDMRDREQSTVRADHVIRWRINSNGERESNARLVEWDDGTVQLQVGSEYFNASIVTEAPDTHLYVRHANGLIEAQAPLSNKMSVRIPALASKAHSTLRRAIQGRHRTEKKLVMTSTLIDPEVEHKQAELERSKIIKSKERVARRQMQTRDRYNSYGSYLEGAEVADGDIGAIRARHNHERYLSRKRGRDDEEDADRLNKIKGGYSDDDDEYEKLSDEDGEDEELAAAAAAEADSDDETNEPPAKKARRSPPAGQIQLSWGNAESSSDEEGDRKRRKKKKKAEEKRKRIVDSESE